MNRRPVDLCGGRAQEQGVRSTKYTVLSTDCIVARYCVLRTEHCGLSTRRSLLTAFRLLHEHRERKWRGLWVLVTDCYALEASVFSACMVGGRMGCCLIDGEFANWKIVGDPAKELAEQKRK